MRPMLASWMTFLVAACGAPAVEQGDEGVPAVYEPPADGFFLGEGDAPVAIAGTPIAALEQPLVAPGDRSVVYSAALRLVVVSAREALASIQRLAGRAGGHLQESDSRSITVRVPAAQFEAVLAEIAELGEVVDRSVRAADVTEEVSDLGIRLENARKARERLLEHLERSTAMEDTLAIERELARVTGEIEELEARMRRIQSDIAMSAIRVELNASSPRLGRQGLGLPFEWLERLGDGLVAGTVQSLPRKPRFLSRGPRFDPPAEFIRYYSSDELVEAMSADGVRIKVQEHDNYDEGALEFWRRLARRALVETRALAVTREEDLPDGRALISGTREVGGETYGYLLVLARSKKELHTFEAWGPEEAFDRHGAALVDSAKSLRR